MNTLKNTIASGLAALALAGCAANKSAARHTPMWGPGVMTTDSGYVSIGCMEAENSPFAREGSESMAKEKVVRYVNTQRKATQKEVDEDAMTSKIYDVHKYVVLGTQKIGNRFCSKIFVPYNGVQ